MAVDGGRAGGQDDGDPGEQEEKAANGGPQLPGHPGALAGDRHQGHRAGGGGRERTGGDRGEDHTGHGGDHQHLALQSLQLIRGADKPGDPDRAEKPGDGREQDRVFADGQTRCQKERGQHARRDGETPSGEAFEVGAGSLGRAGQQEDGGQGADGPHRRAGVDQQGE